MMMDLDFIVGFHELDDRIEACVMKTRDLHLWLFMGDTLPHGSQWDLDFQFKFLLHYKGTARRRRNFSIWKSATIRTVQEGNWDGMAGSAETSWRESTTNQMWCF